MKLTNKQIKQIIREELNKVLNENISQEKLMVLAEMFLSNREEDFRQALMFLESLEIIQNVTFEDKTAEFDDDIKHFEKYKDIKREDYKWSMLATPEFYAAGAEVLGEIGRFGPNITFEQTFTDEKYKWTYSFFKGHNPGDMPQISVKKQVRPDY